MGSSSASFEEVFREHAVAQGGDSVIVIPRYGASDRVPVDQVVAASVDDWLALPEIEPAPFMP